MTDPIERIRKVLEDHRVDDAASGVIVGQRAYPIMPAM